MKIKDRTSQCLEKFPESRERKNRARLVWWVLQQEESFKDMGKEMFCKLFSKAETISRWARKIQAENVELRGKDYDDKELLEQEKQIEFGYEPGANQESNV